MTQKICLKHNTFYDETCGYCDKEILEEKQRNREKIIAGAIGSKEKKELEEIRAFQTKGGFKTCQKCGTFTNGYKYCPECFKKIANNVKEHDDYWKGMF